MEVILNIVCKTKDQKDYCSKKINSFINNTHKQLLILSIIVFIIILFYNTSLGCIFIQLNFSIQNSKFHF